MHAQNVPLILILAALWHPCVAQTNRLFQWQFANNLLSASLPTCLPLSIIVKSYNVTTNSTQGKPPYYMMSFAIDGIPKTELIGVDNDTISWTVRHPVGTQLMLSVVDSTGSAGGVATRIFDVIAGQSTQCVDNPPPQPDFTIKSNVTGDLQTCQPWGTTVKGGVPPYNITLAALNSPVVTNVTMPFGDDVFTYINRADPNGQLLIAISDFTGRWANGTPIVNTKGSTDIDCTGLVSSSGNSTQMDELRNTGSHGLNKRIVIIIVVCACLGGLISLVIAAIIWLCYRARRNAGPRPIETAEPDLTDVYPRQFIPPHTNGMLWDTRTPPLIDGPPQRSGPGTFDPYQAAYEESQTDSTGNVASAISGTTSSARQTTKAAEARRAQIAAAARGEESWRRSGNVLSVTSTSTTMSPTSRLSSASAHSPRSSVHSPHSPTSPLVADVNESGELVFQHSDAGRPVREVPPPYPDRAPFGMR